MARDIILTKKLDISFQTRTEVIEDIRQPGNWMKPSRDKSSNVLVKIRTHWFFDTCSVAAKCISDKIFNEIISDDREWIIDSLWGAIYNKGEYAQSHTHGKNMWSWVYFVDCCNKCAPLVFNETEIVPEVNLLVYFDGMIKHEVPSHICDHERIILAGNIKKDEKMMTFKEAYG